MNKHWKVCGPMLAATAMSLAACGGSDDAT